jgi:DNA-binding PadR family transcriptional regulator
MSSEFSPTARVILGMLRLGSRTGYEIKQKIEISTRFFWGASYGQIYPELKRLERAGLVESEPDSASGRRRRLYSLTPAGEAAVVAWLTGPSDLYELRDEALLKLFFGDLLTPEQIAANLRLRLDSMREVLEMFRRIDEMRVEGWGPVRYPDRTLHYGIALVGWMIDWYEHELAEVSRTG